MNIPETHGRVLCGDTRAGTLVLDASDHTTNGLWDLLESQPNKYVCSRENRAEAAARRGGDQRKACSELATLGQLCGNASSLHKYCHHHASRATGSETS